MTRSAPGTLKVDTQARTLSLGALTVPCVLGKGGVIEERAKREGDGCTPLGRYPLKAALFRPGRAAPPPGFALPWRWTRTGDGWSDASADPAYNRPVTLPHAFSAETLQRDDCLYDIVLVIGHNDAPPVPGMGSAIFLHVWDEAKPASERATQGCVAIARESMEALLPLLRAGIEVAID